MPVCAGVGGGPAGFCTTCSALTSDAATSAVDRSWPATGKLAQTKTNARVSPMTRMRTSHAALSAAGGLKEQTNKVIYALWASRNVVPAAIRTSPGCRR